MRPADRGPASRSAFLTPFLLLGTGGLLSVVVLVTRMAADSGTPMLWFLAASQLGAGLALAAALRQPLGPLWGMRGYAAGAGIMTAVPSAMGYLSVGHVGAGYVALMFAFPVLLTWLLALPLGMDRFSPARALSLALGVAGGVAVAVGKAGGTGSAALVWVAVATLMPLALAAGNLYRARYWPAGAAPLAVSTATLLAGALVTLPAALVAEGGAVRDLVLPGPAAALLAMWLVLAVQYTMQMKLLLRAGPVVMSQIGWVAALCGAVLAVVLLGESLPRGFTLSAVLIAAGLWLFHRARDRA